MTLETLFANDSIEIKQKLEQLGETLDITVPDIRNQVFIRTEKFLEGYEIPMGLNWNEIEEVDLDTYLQGDAPLIDAHNQTERDLIERTVRLTEKIFKKSEGRVNRDDGHALSVYEGMINLFSDMPSIENIRGMMDIFSNIYSQTFDRDLENTLADSLITSLNKIEDRKVDAIRNADNYGQSTDIISQKHETAVGEFLKQYLGLLNSSFNQQRPHKYVNDEAHLLVDKLFGYEIQRTFTDTRGGLKRIQLVAEKFDNRGGVEERIKEARQKYGHFIGVDFKYDNNSQEGVVDLITERNGKESCLRVNMTGALNMDYKFVQKVAETILETSAATRQDLYASTKVAYLRLNDKINN